MIKSNFNYDCAVPYTLFLRKNINFEPNFAVFFPCLSSIYHYFIVWYNNKVFFFIPTTSFNQYGDIMGYNKFKVWKKHDQSEIELSNMGLPVKPLS